MTCAARCCKTTPRRSTASTPRAEDMAHPFRDVAIVGIANTEQARELPGHDSESITLDASLLALEDAGIHPHEVDAVVSELAQHIVLALRLGPAARWIN